MIYAHAERHGSTKYIPDFLLLEWCPHPVQVELVPWLFPHQQWTLALVRSQYAVKGKSIRFLNIFFIDSIISVINKWLITCVILPPNPSRLLLTWHHNNWAPSNFRLLWEFVGDLFWTSVFFFGSYAPSEYFSSGAMLLRKISRSI